MNIRHIIITRVCKAAVCACALICASAAHGLPLDTYAPASRLAEGKWVKVSIPESGVYLLTNAQLSQWGFNDPKQVRVYGYGGKRIADRLSSENYIDDLPAVQSVVTAKGVVFYGDGPEKWVEAATGRMRRENSIYTTKGYYFVTASSEAVPEIPKIGTTATEGATTYTDRLHYETDITSPGEAGYILVGESFKSQNNRKFSFDIPGYQQGTDIWMETAVVTKTSTSTMINFTVNGQKLAQQASDKINSVSANVYIHGGYTQTQKTFNHVTGNKLDVIIGVTDAASTLACWLDYISVNYTRALALPSSGHLNFWLDSYRGQMTTAAKDVHVWDVTTPLSIKELNTTEKEGTLLWANDYSGMRDYVAWSESGSLPSPTLVGTVSNQNIHGIEVPDMVIFSLPEYITQSQRLADIHAAAQNPLKVTVLNVDQVYNEFGSGAPDVSALRKCLKMLYDRGRSAEEGTKLSYALLMGRATYDNRHLTSQFASANAHGTIPNWMGGAARNQFSDNEAFNTDDFIAMLDDDSGTALGLDDLSVAVGRMPVTSVSEAKNAIDKLSDYMLKSVPGTWKNSFLFLADDGDNGIHLNQTENIISELESTPDNQNYISKVYVDAYDIIGGVCEGGRKDMYRMLDEGIVWWNFCGHANNHSWTGEGMFTFTDINNLYLRKIPVLMAATCDFLRWDSNTLSGGEILFHERNGGTIATISATRPVYISDNGLLTRAIGRAISQRDSDGNLPRLGDIYRNAKNNILNDKGEHRSNPNRLRYVLMGDPALALAMPSNMVRLESIGGVDLDSDAQVTIKALEQTTLKGTVRRANGEVYEDFNGTLMVNIYDADRSLTTKGERDENVQITFEDHGSKLFSGSGTVTNGVFELTVAMPSEIADNFRPAFINMFAYDKDGNEAVGINNKFYVYGLDEDREPDTEAPVIHTMGLNATDFKDGTTVNEDPMLIADITDNVSINISSAGIGHQMVLTLDGKKTYTDVSLFYTPDPTGTPGGTINYPISGLADGEHTLQLKVWDTSSNSASRTITFNVQNGLLPSIMEVYTDANPASTAANFYIKHDRPDANMTVTITVYNLLGHPLWETTEVGLSNMFLSSPVTWDLCDNSGRRVPRGIYLYRASISADGEHFETAARKLAVTGTSTPQ